MTTARALAALLLTGSAAFAQDQSALPPWEASVTPSSRYVFEADLGDASVSVFRNGLAFGVGGPVSETTFVRLGMESEYAAYEFDNLTGFGLPDDGPDDLLFVELRPSISTYLNPNFGLYGGLILGAGGEPDADFGDALYYGGFVGFNYQIRPGLWIGTGVGATTQLEDNALIVPLLTLDWTITDRLTLSASGLTGRLTYKVDDNWSLFADGRYEFREYRLASDTVILPDGVLTDESVPLGLGVTYAVADNFSVSLSGGAILWRSLELSDEDGDALVDEDADVTGFVSASVKWSF
jgi:opacity protein-like surface antigen